MPGAHRGRRCAPDASTRILRPVTIDLNGIRLRNRLVTSASLLGYGASRNRLILYGLSPIAQWVPLERFGAVTTRTLTLEPRAGHFTLREDWGLGESAGDAAPLRPRPAQGRRRLAQRLRLVEHRARALLRRVLRAHRRPQPDRVGGRLLGRRDRGADRDRQRAGEAGRDRGDRAQRLVPQRQLPVRHDPRGGAPACGAAEPPPGDPQGLARRGLPVAGAPGRDATAVPRSPRSTP